MQTQAHPNVLCWKRLKHEITLLWDAKHDSSTTLGSFKYDISKKYGDDILNDTCVMKKISNLVDGLKRGKSGKMLGVNLDRPRINATSKHVKETIHITTNIQDNTQVDMTVGTSTTN